MPKFATRQMLKAAAVGLCAVMLVGARNDPEIERLGQFEERLLAAHNAERAMLGLAPLKWDPELAEGAEAWADHLSSTGRFEHSPNDPNGPMQGENIWGGTPRAFTLEDMVELWIHRS